MNNGRQAMDDIDYRIIEMLQEDGRVTMSELGRRISMSSVAVGDRVRRLQELGVITGFTAVLDKDRLGLSIHAFILVDNIPPERQREFSAYVDSQPNIAANYRVMTGGKEALLNVYCDGADQLFDIQSQLKPLAAFSTFLVEPRATKKTIKQI